MAAELPGVRNLRLQPSDRVEPAGAMGGQWSQGGSAGSTSEQDEEYSDSTIRFKDLATLVAVVLDRRDELEQQQGSGFCERKQGAHLSDCRSSAPVRRVHRAHQSEP